MLAEMPIRFATWLTVMVAPLVVVETCSKFPQAFEMLERFRFDMVILDLKDDDVALPDDNAELPGLKIFAQIRNRRFLPVVFYTALPERVRDRVSPFVRVVEKTKGILGIRTEVRTVLGTHLPSLSRHLEDEQRAYMWDFMDSHWKELTKSHERIDLTYLLARRLAFSLRGPMIRKFAGQIGGDVPATDHDVHPMEMYVAPPVKGIRLAGDIVKITRDTKVTKDGTEVIEPKETWHIVLTPSCDFEQCKADSVLLARCFRLIEQDEYVKWKKVNPPSNGATKDLQALIGDNRGGQRDRFKFLPATFFMPDLIVDLQQLESIQKDELEKFTAVASLDSPYAESLLARFSRYYGRLGTPNLDKEIVINRLKAEPAPAAPQQATQPQATKAAPVAVPSKPLAPPSALQ